MAATLPPSRKGAPIEGDARIRIKHARLGYNGSMSFSIKVTLVDSEQPPKLDALVHRD